MAKVNACQRFRWRRHVSTSQRRRVTLAWPWRHRRQPADAVCTGGRRVSQWLQQLRPLVSWCRVLYVAWTNRNSLRCGVSDGLVTRMPSVRTLPHVLWRGEFEGMITSRRPYISYTGFRFGDGWTPVYDMATMVYSCRWLSQMDIRYDTIRYDRWFALENWQASCQFNLAHELKEN